MRRITLLCFSLFLSLALQGSAQVPEKLEVSELRLENIQYPFPVNFYPVTNQGEKYEMAFMDVKPDNWNQQTVVLFHGKNFNGFYWKETAEFLSSKGFRVIIPDQIGFGKSSKPKFFQYSIALLAANTKSLLDVLNIKHAAVLGHSMGGMIATRFALQYPDFTTKLILENPIGLEDYQRYQPYQGVDFWYEQELNQNYASLKDYQLKAYYDNQWKAEYDSILNPLAGWTINKSYPLIAWNAALTKDMIITQPVCNDFKNLTVPTLLIIGQRDRTYIGDKKLAPVSVREELGNYPLLGRRTKKLIPKATLVELPGIGHLPHIEDFPRFSLALIQFLNQ